MKVDGRKLGQFTTNLLKFYPLTLFILTDLLWKAANQLPVFSAKNFCYTAAISSKLIIQ